MTKPCVFFEKQKLEPITLDLREQRDDVGSIYCVDSSTGGIFTAKISAMNVMAFRGKLSVNDQHFVCSLPISFGQCQE